MDIGKEGLESTLNSQQAFAVRPSSGARLPASRDDRPIRSSEGYDYPVPKNPLSLPERTTKSPASTTLQTTTTAEYIPDCIAETDISVGRNPEFLEAGVPLCPSDEPVTGYEYPVPENPLTLPTTPATTSTTTTTPTSITTTTTTRLVTVLTTSTEKGYEYPVPKNPLQLPKKVGLEQCCRPARIQIQLFHDGQIRIRFFFL